MNYKIYTLSHPSTGNIFYVGCSSNIKNRLRQHSFSYAKHLAKVGRLRETKDAYILASRINPVCHVIEEVFDSKEQAAIREGFWISFLLEHGFPIVNKGNRSMIVKEKATLNDLPIQFLPVIVSSNYGIVNDKPELDFHKQAA